MSSPSSNQDDEKVIVPATPEFRRMQIGLAPPMPKPVSAVPQTKQAQAVTSTTAPSSSSPQWKVASALIPQLDDFYPLEKTHVIVSEEAQTVADQISQQFQSPSIATTFDESSCTVVVDDSTELVIQLFWDEEGRLVVECQRVQGCGFTFRQLAKAALQAAKGATVGAAPVQQRPPVPPIPESNQPSQEEEALKLALQLIQSDRVDALELGCQSLVHLTNTTAAITSDQAQEIIRQLPALNQKKESYLRPSSLQILGNLLERTTSFALPKDLVASLQQDAQTSADPFTAHQAARCLQALRPSGPPAMPAPRTVF